MEYCLLLLLGSSSKRIQEGCTTGRLCTAHFRGTLYCNNRLVVFPSPAGMSLTRKIYKFPARESLVSDILAGDGKTANHFLQCSWFVRTHHWSAGYTEETSSPDTYTHSDAPNFSPPAFLLLSYTHSHTMIILGIC